LLMVSNGIVLLLLLSVRTLAQVARRVPSPQGEG
jgi:hypothetical protein